MKKVWKQKYKSAIENTDFNSKVLSGFNANIDCSLSFKNLDLNLEDVKAEKKESIKSRNNFKKMVKYCRETKSNQESSIKEFNPEINGEKQLGGQGGIIANFLHKLGNKSIMYTPFLSKKLAKQFEDEIVYPTVEDSLKLKRIGEAINSDRTKENYIIEFEEESCRLILSDNLKGFGPYFRKSLEEKLSEANDFVDRIILSGFHDVEGNIESKLEKSRKQMEKIETPKHLEYVSKNEKMDKLYLEKIIPEFSSLGLDEQELKNMAKILDLDVSEKVSLGEAYETAKEVIKETGLERIHVHTINFFLVVASDSYPVKPEKIRKGILFGGIAAASMAEKGSVPEKNDLEFNNENMHINQLEELKHFEDFFNLENFRESGVAHIEDYKVVAAPTIVHEDPERLVGLGDIISSGAFIAEIN